MCKIKTLYLIENKEKNTFSIARYVNYEIVNVLKTTVRKAQRILSQQDIVETQTHIIRTISNIDLGNRGGRRERKQVY